MGTQKILRLKYGEYYSLKRTDRSKNIINNVEFTPKKLSAKQVVLSTPNIGDFANDETFTTMLKLGLNADQRQDEEFNSWTYRRGSEIIEKYNSDNNTLVAFPVDISESGGYVKYDLRCELQILTLFNAPTFVRWVDDFASTSITDKGNTIECKIKLNNDYLRSLFPLIGLMPSSVLAWRYKLIGGEVKAESQTKQTFPDYDSQRLRGKHSYTYPESTLLTEDAKINGELLYEKNIKHILSTYKAGRETVELSWQGDPTLTIGDILEIENKMGIAQRYMVTGNKFDLNNNGKFSMTTQGISLI